MTIQKANEVLREFGDAIHQTFVVSETDDSYDLVSNNAFHILFWKSKYELLDVVRWAEKYKTNKAATR